MPIIKKIKIVFLFIFLVFLSSQSKSEIKIAFIEMDTLINQSLAGKSLTEQLDKINKKNIKDFNEIEKKLLIEKNDLSKKKNILSNDEYKKKVIELNKKFNSTQADVKSRIKLIQSKKDEGIAKILKELNILLSEYSNKNQLTFIIDQKNVVIGKTELNITKEILKSLNQKISKININ